MKRRPLRAYRLVFGQAIDFDGPIIGQPMEWRLAG